MARQNLFACARGRCLNRFRVFPIRDLEGTVRCVNGRLIFFLPALRRSGKNELLEKLLESYEQAQDYKDIENMPNTSDFQALRDTALLSF